MNFKILAIVGLGGFLGSSLRYLTYLFFMRFESLPVFPFGTFSVNFLGCFIIGLLYGLSEQHSLVSPEWRLFLITGFCGGFTTFSAFAYENLAYLQQGNYLSFALYSLLSFALCIIAVYTGLVITR
jgi:CrcB protein